MYCSHQCWQEDFLDRLARLYISGLPADRGCTQSVTLTMKGQVGMNGNERDSVITICSTDGFLK